MNKNHSKQTQQAAKITEETSTLQAAAQIQKITPSLPAGETYELQNEIYTAKFTTKGAGITSLRLKEWGRRKMGEINLIEPISGFGAAFVSPLVNNEKFGETTDFSLEKIDNVTSKIDFVREIPGDLRFRKSYELIPQKSALKLTLEFENLSSASRSISYEILSQLHFGTKHDRYEMDQLESFVSIKNGKVLVQKTGKIKKNPFVVSDVIEWNALTRKYLSIITKPDFSASYSETNLAPNSDGFQNKLRFDPQVLAPGTILKREFLIYAGPEYYEQLKEFGLEDTLIQGTWGAIRHWLFLALRFCRNFTGSYGFAILLMTFLLKVLFSPFTHMSFDSMRKMQVVQPKLKAIQIQFKNDPARLNKETMELYKRHKVNPMGGCLPMLIQIPIFIGFYQVLAQFVELKGESFWWIKDLTEPDRIAQIPGTGFAINLLPLLMIATMILQQKVTPQQATSSPEQAKMMQFMPIIFGFLFYGLPAGLVLYWTLNNLLTVIHQSLFHWQATKKALLEA